MEAFNHAYEQERIRAYRKYFLETSSRVETSVANQVWALVAERTETLNPFDLNLNTKKQVATAVGFEHQGDLLNTYQNSLEKAEVNQDIAARFQLENKGFEEVKKRLLGLPLYSTVLLFSPPPKLEMKKYGYGGKSMAYFYYILPGEKKEERLVKALTWENDFSEADFAEILNTLFREDLISADEVSILTSPVGIYGNQKRKNSSLEEVWQAIEKVYAKKERNFILSPLALIEKYLFGGEEMRGQENAELAILIDEFAKQYISGMTPSLEKKWRIILNLADNKLLHQDITAGNEILPAVKVPTGLEGNIFRWYEQFDKPTRTVFGSCGSSGGEKDTISENPLEQFTNSLFRTQTFKISTEKSERTFHCTCRACGEEVEAKIADGEIHCPKCHATAPYKC